MDYTVPFLFFRSTIATFKSFILSFNYFRLDWAAFFPLCLLTFTSNSSLSIFFADFLDDIWRVTVSACVNIEIGIGYLDNWLTRFTYFWFAWILGTSTPETSVHLDYIDGMRRKNKLKNLCGNMDSTKKLQSFTLIS